MQMVTYGKENLRVAIFLHGGGLAPWSCREVAERLKDDFYVVVPVLDGHSGSGREFISIKRSACALIQFIDQHFGGQVFFIGGLSLGGQILIEMLSQRKDICRFAFIESALALPMRVTSVLIKPAFSLSYPLIRRRWFAKLQYKAMHIKPQFFEEYFKDSAAIRKEDMIRFLQANANYRLKPALSDCRAKMLVTAGSREKTIIKKSAAMIHRAVAGSALEVIQDYSHGDLSINHPEEYVRRLRRLIAEN